MYWLGQNAKATQNIIAEHDLLIKTLNATQNAIVEHRLSILCTLKVNPQAQNFSFNIIFGSKNTTMSLMMQKIVIIFKIKIITKIWAQAQNPNQTLGWWSL